MSSDECRTTFFYVSVSLFKNTTGHIVLRDYSYNLTRPLMKAYMNGHVNLHEQSCESMGRFM